MNWIWHTEQNWGTHNLDIYVVGIAIGFVYLNFKNSCEAREPTTWIVNETRVSHIYLVSSLYIGYHILYFIYKSFVLAVDIEIWWWSCSKVLLWKLQTEQQTSLGDSRWRPEEEDWDRFYEYICLEVNVSRRSTRDPWDYGMTLEWASSFIQNTFGG